MSILVVSPGAIDSLSSLRVNAKRKMYLDTYKAAWLAQGSPEFARVLKSLVDREVEVLDVEGDPDALRQQLTPLGDKVFVSNQTDLSHILSNPQVASNVYQDEPDKQQQLKDAHDEIYSVLSELCQKYGCRLQFVGSSFAGMKIPENYADLDYRILVPAGKSLRKVGQRFAQEYNKLDYNDEVSNQNIVKYDIDFDLGKADVSFVSMEAWRQKIDASQLTPFLPGNVRDQLLQQKRAAFQQGYMPYKAAKTDVANKTLGHFGIEPQKFKETLNFKAWFYQNEGS